MTVQGIVRDGVVVLEGEERFAEGTVVTVTAVPVPIPPVEELNENDPIYRLFELAGPGGIPDLSVNLDHYLYGHPKVTDAGQ